MSPWSRVSLNASYKRRDRENEYSHRIDTDLSGTPGNGYPAFILARDQKTDEFEVRLTLRAAAWLRTTFKYQLTATDFVSVTGSGTVPGFPPTPAPGGAILAGNYDAHVYSLNATLTPWSRLQFTTTLSYSDTRQTSGVNNGAQVVPFGGGIYSLLGSGTFVLTDKTDLNASYSFNRSELGQSNEAGGLPLGLDYTLHSLQAGVSHRLHKQVRTGVHYLFQRYLEPGGGGNDYTAHGIFATLTMPWP